MSDPSPASPPEEVLWHLQRTDGFLDLRMPGRAREEFARIPEAWRNDPDVLRIGLRLASEADDWPAAREAASRLHALQPNDASWFVMLAFATRRTEGLPAAEAILREARTKFPEVAVIPFNLACYACLQGREDQALAHLAAAVRLDPAFADLTLEDEDLRAIWPKIGG